jgi:nitrite reductase/ring-hydroxylating ferredoxin subunit
LIAVTSIRDTEIASIWEEATFRAKNPDKGKMANTKVCCPWHKKFFCITDVLVGSFVNNTAA